MNIRRLWPVAVLALVGACVLGCAIKLKGKGATGIRVSTEWAVFHESSATSTQPAEIETDFPSVEELIYRAGDDDESGGESEADGTVATDP